MKARWAPGETGNTIAAWITCLLVAAFVLLKLSQCGR